MKNIRPFLLIILSIILFERTIAQDNCSVPTDFKKQLLLAKQASDYTEADFHRLNSILFNVDNVDSFTTLSNCDLYKNSIKDLFNSENTNKRVLAYRLIGVVRDTSFNTRLIERIKLDEGSLAKTWCATALMENRAPNSSEELFHLFAGNEDKTSPLRTLIKMYSKYDTVAVKNTCWQHIDSKNRKEQILSIQCLATYDYDSLLVSKIKEFVVLWDIESKGWAISSLSMQRAGNLKMLLEPYSNNKDLIGSIIRALKKSPTKEDNDFARKLEKKWRKK